MTSARKRRTPDVLRMGMAMSYPGIDPRSWITAGRIDSDPQAFRWDDKLGWVVDVSMYGGALDGVNEVPCRTLGQGRGNDQGEFIPPAQGCEALVALPGGDVEQNPVIVGTLTNKGDCLPPTEINGLPIQPGTEKTQSTEDLVSPFDTEIKKSPYNRREEFGGDTFHWATNRTIKLSEDFLFQAKNITWEIDEAVIIQTKTTVIGASQAIDGLLLGSDEATEPFIKGNAHSTNLSAVMDAIDLFATAIAPVVDAKLVATPGVVVGLAATLKASIIAFKAQLVEGADLSLKIKGE